MSAAAALTALLGLDDLFLLHERILPKLGVPQTAVLLAYAVAGLAYFAGFFREIREREFAVLCVGLVALGTSLGIDLFVKSQGDGLKLAEDSAKFFGVAGWAGFHWLRAKTVLTTMAAKP